MIKIELFPDLDHCIETVAKREHAAVLKQLLTPGKVNKELGKNWRFSAFSWRQQISKSFGTNLRSFLRRGEM